MTPWQIKNPDGYRAHCLVRNAKRKGVLVPQPCEVCGLLVKRMHAHHDDYAAPLDVRWFCPSHHLSGVHGKRAGSRAGADRVCTAGRLCLRAAVNIPAPMSESVCDTEAVHRVLSRLPDRDRRVLEARFFRGLTLAQVGRELGITRERVRQHQTTAVSSFCAAFAQFAA